MIVYQSAEQLTRLIAGFENGTLPKLEWTHQAHLVMAVWYLSTSDTSEITDVIRSGIKKYNEAVGTENTDTGGYHETITLFYIWFVHKFLANANPENSLVENTNNFCAQYGDKNLPLQYYSKDLLMSVEARRNWVEPDLQPLSESATSQGCAKNLQP